jgi:MFS family permease
MPPDSAGRKFGVHPDVLKLGLVSFLTDLSSEMIFSVFAIFFTTIAGASAALLGLVEGFADLSASSLNYVAGWLSDRTGRRKVFALAGYGFSTLAKIILLVSSSIIGLSVFRVIERLGKSFRGPPRDAWLSAVADKDTRGYSFGVRWTRPVPCSDPWQPTACSRGSETAPGRSGSCSGLRSFPPCSASWS